MDIGHRFILECAVTDWRNGIEGIHICTFSHISISAIEAYNESVNFIGLQIQHN